ncbi:MAG: non-ribosomal peptide synthetase [Rhodospirillales bacterium]|nr:non-ribosomal peptide synthetase [Rhodospirillales bacterium]
MAGVQPGVATSATCGGGVDAFDFEDVGGTITGRFAASAAAAAASVAMVQRDQTTTYAELDRRSNKLARYLVRQGVGAGDVIALHAGRSVGSIVAILATLKVGAAYAPLDPATPPDCLAWLVHDCGARLTLTGRSDAADLPGQVLGLDAALAACEREDGSAIEDRCRPDDIAYLMYTSGSTGRPKGAAVPHRAVVRLVTDQTYARFAADEVFLHAAPLPFDASTFEIWGTLLHGARGVVVEEDRASLQQIADTIRRQGVTTAWFTAGLFHLLVDHQLLALRDMRQILAGGDVLSPTHVRRAQAKLPNCQLINGYGPTENTTFTCCYRIPKAGWGAGPVPIGTPIRGTYVRLLDDDMNPVADGEIGMLYAGGLGLASGYLGDARRSAAMFVPDPFHPGATIYRTGDLARRRPDGAFDYIGRRDRQVKIDGKRVELGEIEETLRRSVSIADAVVTASKVDGSHVLTAYIKGAAANSDPSMLAAEARNDLLRTLPPHMRPARIVVLDEFPLKTCGKVDHDRLPKPYPLHAETVQPAEDNTESWLREIFGRKLGVRNVGADTNFFDLGATSLKLVEAHAAIERIWPGVNVVALFRHPNIRDLARAIEGRDTSLHPAARRRAQQQADALKRMQRSRLAR